MYFQFFFIFYSSPDPSCSLLKKYGIYSNIARAVSPQNVPKDIRSEKQISLAKGFMRPSAYLNSKWDNDFQH